MSSESFDDDDDDSHEIKRVYGSTWTHSDCADFNPGFQDSTTLFRGGNTIHCGNVSVFSKSRTETFSSNALNVDSISTRSKMNGISSEILPQISSYKCKDNQTARDAERDSINKTESDMEFLIESQLKVVKTVNSIKNSSRINGLGMIGDYGYSEKDASSITETTIHSNSSSSLASISQVDPSVCAPNYSSCTSLHNSRLLHSQKSPYSLESIGNVKCEVHQYCSSIAQNKIKLSSDEDGEERGDHKDNAKMSSSKVENDLENTPSCTTPLSSLSHIAGEGATQNAISCNKSQFLRKNLLSYMDDSYPDQNTHNSSQSSPSSPDISSTEVSRSMPLGIPLYLDKTSGNYYERNMFSQKIRRVLPKCIHTLIINNYYVKPCISLLQWFISYEIMGMVGGTIAAMHFPRTSRDVKVPQSLPDFGYDIIPYYCPSISIIGLGKHENIQSLVLLTFYIVIFAAVLVQWIRDRLNTVVVSGRLPSFNDDGSSVNDDWDNIATDDHNITIANNFDGYFRGAIVKPNDMDASKQCNIKLGSSDDEDNSDYDSDVDDNPSLVILNWKERERTKTSGRIILQQLLHMNSLLFITRTTTVCLTGLPQPNPRCVRLQHIEMTYRKAFKFVMGRGFPPHSCGDLIYSGHVGCILICLIVLTKHKYLESYIVKFVAWAWASVGILSTVSCRSHYTVDVVLAIYFSFGIQDFYFARSCCLVHGGLLGDWIRFLEGDHKIGRGV